MTGNLAPDTVARYRQAGLPLPDRFWLWPLYGAGLDNLGREGRAIELSMPVYGPDELLVRHDACGLCFSDIKVIKLGPAHPRIFRDMQTKPVTLGHEVSMTVVGVGENLCQEYRAGDRFIVQADILNGGVGCAYGYEIQGGLSQYSVIDQRILNGDDGNYLVPVQPGTGYAEAALIEPWACVSAAYDLAYRTGLKPGGTTWIIGAERGGDVDRRYTISSGFDEAAHPARLLLTRVPPSLAEWLGEQADALGVKVREVDDVGRPPVTPVDDIVLLGADADMVEVVSPHLADHGVVALIAEAPMPRRVAVDVGRVHYNGWVTVGGRGPDIARAYGEVPVRAALRPGGRTWFVGAGGPMGRMHVQRALQSAHPPSAIVCSDISDLRLEDLRSSYSAEAVARGIGFACLNPANGGTYQAALVLYRGQGFDDIVVLAPSAAVITDVAACLAPQGVMNIFAGVPRGTIADLDLSQAYLRDVRVIGHSGSTIDDLRRTLHQAETGQLSPNRLVSAIGSLSAAREGLEAVLATAFPGKVVIYPQIEDMPLTTLPDLKYSMPSVYAMLGYEREWTVEAEDELLRLMLP